MPFDPASARPQTKFDPSSAKAPEVSESAAKRSGYLKDPKLDEEAYIEAKRRFDETPDVPGLGMLDRFSDPFAFNISRGISGVREMMPESLGVGEGKGFQYGKAVDRYYDDMVRAKTGIPGMAAEVAGTLTSPSPIGKGTGAVKVGTKILGDAALAAGEQQMLATETDQRDIMTDMLLGGGVSAAGRGVRGVAEHLPFGLDRLAKVPERVSDAAALTGSRVAAGQQQGPYQPQYAPSPQDLQRYYMQQLLMNGGQ